MADAGVDKKRRYDRQLRIWGEQGQARLESARVCLLHCGPTGTEALKNLVLGGIAAFTLVDGAKVTPADLGNKCVAAQQRSTRRSPAPPLWQAR
jgi:amyloid beta precursor protein binding protein 1